MMRMQFVPLPLYVRNRQYRFKQIDGKVVSSLLTIQRPSTLRIVAHQLTSEEYGPDPPFRRSVKPPGVVYAHLM
jgi:hypothetical protein